MIGTDVFIVGGIGAHLIVASLAFSTTARADLQDDVSRLLSEWKPQRPYHLGPRILEQGDELPLLLPDGLTQSTSRGCLHIVALSAQTVQFAINLPSPDATLEDVTIPSRAGLVEFVHCGKFSESVVTANVTMISPRGALDIIGFIDQRPQADALQILPRRAAGIEAPERNLVRSTDNISLTTRLEQLEQRAAFQSATRTERINIKPNDLRAGQLLVGFDPGCHELKLVVSFDNQELELPELNPELVWADNAQLAVSELSTSPVPTLRLCTAAARLAKLTFAACPEKAKAVLFRAYFSWPQGIPSNWAADARNQMAETLFRRHLPSLPTLPAQAWMGGGSATALGVSLSPRLCYLAIVATSQGAINDLSLSVSTESLWMADSSLDTAGASVAFCVDQATSVKLDVDARSAQVIWILGLWKIAAAPLYTDLT